MRTLRLRPVSLVLAIAIAAVSVFVLTWVAEEAGPPVHPVAVHKQYLKDLHRRAAESAQGRRILIIRAVPGADATGTIYQSARAPQGWRLFAPASADATEFNDFLDRLANDAARDWAADEGFDEVTVRALGYLDVALVAVENGTAALPIDVSETDPSMSSAGQVPGARIQKAAAVWHYLGERDPEGAEDPMKFARGFRKGDASTMDWQYLMWGLGVTTGARRRTRRRRRPVGLRASHPRPV